MHKRIVALTLFTTVIFSAWWLHPMFEPQAEAAELKSSQLAAKPTTTTPAASSQPASTASCFRGSVLPQPKREKSAKDPSVTLGDSFVIPKELASGTSHIPAVNYRIDGQKLYTVTSTGQLFIWDTSTQKIEQNILLTKDPLQSVTVDQRGCYAAWTTKDSVSLLAIGDTNPTTIKDVAPMGVAISPKEDLIAVSYKDKIELRSTTDAKVKKELKGFTGDLTNLAFSPDGNTLAVTTRGGVLSLIGMDSYKEKTVKKIGALYAVAFSPDSKTVAFGGEERIIYEHNLATDKETVLTKDQPYWITTVSYSPDNEMLAFGDESCDVWLFRRADNKNLFHSKHHVECWLNGIAWAPDSSVFLFGCKPNTYAGQPSIYMGNHMEEANNFGEVTKLDKEIESNAKELEKLLAGDAMAEYRKKFEGARTQQVQSRSINNNFSLGSSGNYYSYGNNISPNGGIYYGNGAPNLILNNNNNDLNINLNGIASFRGAAPKADPEMKKVLEEMSKEPSLQKNVKAFTELNEKRDNSYNERLTFLNESFCVNQWVVRRD